MRQLVDRRLVVVMGLLGVPYVTTALMLVWYFQIDEPFSRHCGILLALEYQAPLLWGAVPVGLMWVADACTGWRRRLGHVALVLFVVAIATARAAQTVSVLQTRNYLDSEAFGHANMIEFVLTAFNVSVFLGIILVPVIFLALAWWPARRSESVAHRRYMAIVVGCIVLGCFSWYRAESKSYLERFSNTYGLSHGPELALFQLLTGLDGPRAEMSGSLSDETRDRLSAFGVIVDPGARRPFYRQRVYDPATATPWKEFAQPPDIVVFFAESLSAKLLGCYGEAPSDVTPWIDGLAARSLKFDNYYNHTTPTVCGLHGSLTSSYQVSSHATYSDPGARAMAGASVLSLAKILADRGYDTTYFGQGSRHETHLGDLTANLGFRRQFFCTTLAELYPDTAKQFGREYPGYIYSGHVSDILMCRYVQRFMAEPSQRPRLLCVSTIGTHFPYTFGEGIRYGDGKEPIRDAVHLLDRSLAETSALLKGRDREVVFVLTADHAMFPTIEMVRVRGKDYSKSVYDRIALIIHRSDQEQGVAVDTLSSSVDFTPTLLHLLGINLENPFMGWSIFGERRGYPRLLGSQNRHLFVKTATVEWSPLVKKIEQMPDVPLGDGRTFTARHFREWLAYLRHEIHNNRIW